jgi:hypothetical protein
MMDEDINEIFAIMHSKNDQDTMVLSDIVDEFSKDDYRQIIVDTIKQLNTMEDPHGSDCTCGHWNIRRKLALSLIWDAALRVDLKFVS